MDHFLTGSTSLFHHFGFYYDNFRYRVNVHLFVCIVYKVYLNVIKNDTSLFSHTKAETFLSGVNDSRLALNLALAR